MCLLFCVHVQSLSHVQLFVTPMDCSPPVSLHMGFSMEEYWSGLPFPTPGDLPDPEIEPVSLASSALVGRFFFSQLYSPMSKGLMESLILITLRIFQVNLKD